MTADGRRRTDGIRRPARGVRVPASVKRRASVSLKACGRCPDGCVAHTLHHAPKRIGVATAGMRAVTGHPIDDEVCEGQWLPFGQDLLHSRGREAPGGASVRPFWHDWLDLDSEGTLRDDMRRLAGIFDQTSSGKSARVIEAFLAKRSKVELYTDPALDAAVANARNFVGFAEACLGAGPRAAQARPRIHQSLRAAGWDVNRALPVLDLGAPAFNRGHEHARWGMFREDFANGLALMMDATQYVMVDVESYEYRSCLRSYRIGLRFAVYDVFGLDDVDLEKFGTSQRHLSLDAQVGITAWWQLQHQRDYAPLITRALVRKRWRVSTEEG